MARKSNVDSNMARVVPVFQPIVPTRSNNFHAADHVLHYTNQFVAPRHNYTLLGGFNECGSMKILYLIIHLSLRIYRKSTKISHNITWKKKVKKLIGTKSEKKLTKEQIAEIKRLYNDFGQRLSGTEWHRFYAGSNGRFSTKYLPEDLFYVSIEPSLNQLGYFPAFTDKNFLDRFFTDLPQPETLLKNCNGIFYADDQIIPFRQAIERCEQSVPLFIKPSVESGGGKNVQRFLSQNGMTDLENKSVETLLKDYGSDFIVQKAVRQHPSMSLLNPTSLNTFRVMSYLDDKKGPRVLSTVVRMGRKGAYVDNSSVGGIMCGVDENGRLREKGYDNLGKSFDQTDGGTPFRDIVLPYFSEVLRSVHALHIQMPVFKVISWDMAVDDKGEVILLEYNVKGQGLNSHQLCNGPVLWPLLEAYASKRGDRYEVSSDTPP